MLKRHHGKDRPEINFHEYNAATPHGTRSLPGSYHSCLDEMDSASAGTASAEGLRMDSKEAPEDEEGLKAQGNFLPLSPETPSFFLGDRENERCRVIEP